MNERLEHVVAKWVFVALLALGTLIAISLLGQWVSSLKRSAIERALADISEIVYSLELFYSKHGVYPTTAQGYLTATGEGKGPPPKVDPWGRKYQYLCPGSENLDYDLWSLGADGVKNEDDIRNW